MQTVHTNSLVQFDAFIVMCWCADKNLLCLCRRTE